MHIDKVRVTIYVFSSMGVIHMSKIRRKSLIDQRSSRNTKKSALADGGWFSFRMSKEDKERLDRLKKTWKMSGAEVMRALLEQKDAAIDGHSGYVLKSLLDLEEALGKGLSELRFLSTGGIVATALQSTTVDADEKEQVELTRKLLDTTLLAASPVEDYLLDKRKTNLSSKN